jgi:hypothetical protein
VYKLIKVELALCKAVLSIIKMEKNNNMEFLLNSIETCGDTCQGGQCRQSREFRQATTFILSVPLLKLHIPVLFFSNFIYCLVSQIALH